MKSAGAKYRYERRVRMESAARRAAANAEGRIYIAHGITHGLSGYARFKCQCTTCVDANAASMRAYRARLRMAEDRKNPPIASA